MLLQTAPNGYRKETERTTFSGGQPADPNQLTQFNNFPGWFPQQANVSSLQQFQSRLPSLFNTKALTNSYNTAATGMMNQGRTAAAAAARAAQNRAMQQGGGSNAVSDFARVSSLGPLYAQRNQMMYDLEQRKAAMNAARAGMEGDVAGRIAGMRQQQQGMLGDFGINQQRLARSADEFNLERDKFAEGNRRYDEDAGRLAAMRGSGLGSGSGGQYGSGGATWEELVTSMIAHNSMNPSASAQWQQMGNALRNTPMWGGRVNIGMDGAGMMGGGGGRGGRSRAPSAEYGPEDNWNQRAAGQYSARQAALRYA